MERRFFYGNGLRGKGLPPGAAAADGAEEMGAGAAENGSFLAGTGSRPPRVNGWQRSSLQAASAPPRIGPWVAIASAAYSEQVGRYLQPPLLTECSAGDSQR